MADFASPSERPSASNTWDGMSLPALQAELVETQTPFKSRMFISDSPDTPSNPKFTVPGKLSFESPFIFTDRFHELSQQIKQIEKRMAEIAELKTHIINYTKTKEVFFEYKKSGYSMKYLNEFAGDILIHKSAKVAFDDLKSEKIPSIKDLKTEYTTLLEQKKKIQIEYVSSRIFLRQIQTAMANVNQLIVIEKDEQSKNTTLQR